MAAPTKAGLDYFPFDVDLLADRKLRRPKMKYGPTATTIYIALLSILYKDKGYYIDYSDKNKDDVLWEILEYMQGKYQPTSDTVAEIIEDLVACELFSGDQFKSKTITSIRAQKTYYRCTVERKAVDIDFNKWLLSEDEMRAISGRSIILSNYINQTNNVINLPINEVNQPINPQSKVKESKVNKREEKTFSVDCFAVIASKKLRDGILQILPHQRVPNDSKINAWAIHIDYMLRLDKRTEGDINDLIDFALADQFWQTNIRSTAKLREKQDTLYAQMMRKNGKMQKTTCTSNAVNKTYVDIDRRRRELGM